jgi:hypothetical protein
VILFVLILLAIVTKGWGPRKHAGPRKMRGIWRHLDWLNQQTPDMAVRNNTVTPLRFCVVLQQKLTGIWGDMMLMECNNSTMYVMRAVMNGVFPGAAAAVLVPVQQASPRWALDSAPSLPAPPLPAGVNWLFFERQDHSFQVLLFNSPFSSCTVKASLATSREVNDRPSVQLETLQLFREDY